MKSVFGNNEEEFFFELAEYCVREIEKKMGDRPVADWRSVDYTNLSNKLGKQTKVYLSENTLRRIFGKLQTSKNYNPQKATRDALAQFIGYRDWNELGLSYRLNFKTESQIPLYQPETSPKKDLIRKKMQPLSFIFALVVLLFFLGMVGIWYFKTRIPNVELICVNPFGNVPHSAIFRLDSRKSFDKKEEFEVDFLEEARRSSISGDKRITKFFKNPGVVYATLLYKGKPIDTASAYLQTKGWVANSGNDTSRAYPVIGLKALDPINIYVTPTQLDSAGLDLKKPFQLGFSNIKPSKISGDNFIFSCKIFSERNRPGNQCVGTAILILGSKDRHILNIFRKECAAYCDYQFSEERSKGTDKYLGALAFDPTDGGTVSIKVKNKHVVISLNGKQVFTTQYRKSVGTVMGVKFVFNGIGKVISPQLNDLATGENF